MSDISYVKPADMDDEGQTDKLKKQRHKDNPKNGQTFSTNALYKAALLKEIWTDTMNHRYSLAG